MLTSWGQKKQNVLTIISSYSIPMLLPLSSRDLKFLFKDLSGQVMLTHKYFHINFHLIYRRFTGIQNIQDLIV